MNAVCVYVRFCVCLLRVFVLLVGGCVCLSFACFLFLIRCFVCVRLFVFDCLCLVACLCALVVACVRV